MLPLFFSGSIPLIFVLIVLFQKVAWRRDLKKQARSYFQEGAWLKFALCLAGLDLAAAISTNLLDRVSPFFSYVASIFLMSMISYGTIDVLRRVRRGQDFDLKDFLPTDQLSKVAGLYFVRGLYLFLWGLLLVIPGVIKTYSYSQAMFILNDHPEIGIDEAITRSRAMMDGHKWELFVLQVSFLGWAILGALTVGVAFVYILPLYTMSMAVFYEYVKKSYSLANPFNND
ncbi:MAG: DUF975 family protein [Turicibacter sp.]|nr:DUF975 family protein [Turicibacter sp.]